LGAVFPFALIGGIIIKCSWKQEEKKSADRFQRFWDNS